MNDDSLYPQADHLREQTKALLDPIVLAPGARVLDLGCGRGGALDLLSELAGPSGCVVGLDQDATSLAAARALV